MRRIQKAEVVGEEEGHFLASGPRELHWIVWSGACCLSLKGSWTGRKEGEGVHVAGCDRKTMAGANNAYNVLPLPFICRARSSCLALDAIGMEGASCTR